MNSQHQPEPNDQLDLLGNRLVWTLVSMLFTALLAFGAHQLGMKVLQLLLILICMGLLFAAVATASQLDGAVREKATPEE